MAADAASGYNRANLPSPQELKESRWIPAAFRILIGRENPAGLLDIGGSLC
jgi:hypothetical protein